MFYYSFIKKIYDALSISAFSFLHKGCTLKDLCVSYYKHSGNICVDRLIVLAAAMNLEASGVNPRHTTWGPLSLPTACRPSCCVPGQGLSWHHHPSSLSPVPRYWDWPEKTKSWNTPWTTADKAESERRHSLHVCCAASHEMTCAINTPSGTSNIFHGIEEIFAGQKKPCSVVSERARN